MTDLEKAQTLIANIDPIKGHIRTVNKCGDCGRLFVRQFIPYGLGHGITWNPCLCQLTAHRPSSTVMEARP